MTQDHLLSALRELARVLAADGIRLTVGGGYGLVLRATRRPGADERTRLRQRLPQRATEDIDCFLDLEIVTSAERMAAIRSALDALGYEPVVPNMQFIRRGTAGLSAGVKLDLLTGPIPVSHAARVRIKEMRVRPVDSSGLHAYLTPEAFSLARGRQELDIGDGVESLTVSVLHPFTYLILKLFALRDRLDRSADAKQRYHALDPFSVWASLTEDEWNQTREFAEVASEEPAMLEARSICRELFGRATSRGVIALRDQMQQHDWRFERGRLEEHVTDFRRDLLFLIDGAESETR